VPSRALAIFLFSFWNKDHLSPFAGVVAAAVRCADRAVEQRRPDREDLAVGQAHERRVPAREVQIGDVLVLLGRRVEASLRLLGATHPATLAAGRANPGRANGGLTAREQEVLTLVRSGLSTAEIAAQLHVRPSTVDSHIRKSMKRLGASNRREAALLATQPS
jgi:DNA-binding CsgD family transcriptional regulator